MNVVWENECASAKDIAEKLKMLYGWNKNTSYTVINQCVAKGLIQRSEPGFTCSALVSREIVQIEELHMVMDDVFNGSPKLLFSTLLDSKALNSDDIEELERLISRMK